MLLTQTGAPTIMLALLLYLLLAVALLWAFELAAPGRYLCRKMLASVVLSAGAVVTAFCWALA